MRIVSKDCFEEFLLMMADRVGFEPTVSCPTPVFKTGALNHSAIYPSIILYKKKLFSIDKMLIFYKKMIKKYFLRT